MSGARNYVCSNCLTADTELAGPGRVGFRPGGLVSKASLTPSLASEQARRAKQRRTEHLELLIDSVW
jgi:hypothetical protein